MYGFKLVPSHSSPHVWVHPVLYYPWMAFHVLVLIKRDSCLYRLCNIFILGIELWAQTNCSYMESVIEEERAAIMANKVSCVVSL